MKHEVSQNVVEDLQVLDHVRTPGIAGIVLAKGRIQNADDTSYASVMLLTTVEGHRFTPFRTARFWFDYDSDQWQSGSGGNFSALTEAVEDFNNWSGVEA